MTAPSSVTTYERQPIAIPVRAVDTLGRHVALSASGVPSGATFVDNGDNTGRLSWTPVEVQAGSYAVALRGDNGAADIESAFSAITVVAAAPVNDDFSAPIVIGDVPFANKDDDQGDERSG